MLADYCLLPRSTVLDIHTTEPVVGSEVCPEIRLAVADGNAESSHDIESVMGYVVWLVCQ
jgi:hypothetical protein